MPKTGLLRKAYLMIAIIITVSTLLFMTLYIAERKESFKREKQLYLLGITTNIEKQFEDKEFYQEVARISALSLSQDKQASMLNKWLRPLLIKTAVKNPACELGIYSRKMERVVASEPNFRPELLRGMTQPESFKMYETQEPVFLDLNKGYGIPIVQVSYPIVYNGQVIGYTWARLKKENVISEIRWLLIEVCAYSFGLWMISMAILYLVFSTLNDKLKNLAVHIRNQEDDLDNFKYFPELLPVQEKIIELQQAFKDENRKKTDVNMELFSNKRTITRILDGIDDVFYALDMDNKIIYANEETQKIVGAKWEDIVGKNILDFFHMPQFKGLLYIDRVKAFKEPIYSEDYIPSLDIWYGKKIYPLAYGGVAIYLRDITEQKNMEHQLTRLDQLNLVGQIAAGISHEIRNPMTTVRGYLQWLGMKAVFQDYNSEFKLMIDELDRANHIITEFLSVAKDKEIMVEKNNLKTTIESILPLLESDALLANKNISASLQEVPCLLFDEKEIKQLILNLVRNALEASDTGQSVHIQTEADQKEICVVVSDQGKGIPPQILEKIGTPFLTTKDNGTGLGLSVCYGIASRHNARIDVESTEKGTTFKVCFPIASVVI